MKSPESETKLQENSSQKAKQWLQRLILILIPVALTIGGVAVLFRLLAREKTSPSSIAVQQSPLSVELADVQTSQIKESSEFIASLQSLNSESIQAKTQGKVSQVFVKKGSQVTAQAPLLQIDSNNQAVKANNNSGGNRAIQSNQLQLQNARTQLQDLEVQQLSKLQNLRLNQEKYEKYSNLAAQGAVSKQTKDEYAQKVEAAKLEFNSLDAKIQAQRATVSSLEKALQQASVKITNNLPAPQTSQKQYKVQAPFKGTVTNISVKVGDLVNPSTRVAIVTQNQPLEVDIPVSLEKKSQLRKGMAVEIINSKGENIGTGKIFFISPQVNQNTRTVLVKALFDNKERKMQAGDNLQKQELIGISIPVY